ncbi:MAG: triose-phosphate isomerase [Candidatus Heimdallarchaeota archaeon]|nr:triose-phosphate isomerase [Candidatus Heimdallarchaeota archaeon]
MREFFAPKIIIDFQAYPETAGEKGMKLAKTAEKVSQELGINIAVCPSLTNLAKYSSELEIPIFSQRLDPFSNYNKSGLIVIDMIKEAGAEGVVINPIDTQQSLFSLEKIVRESRTSRLYTVICTNNEAVSAAVTKLDPHAIAFQPPELVENRIAICDVEPAVIQNNTRRIKIENPRISPICGAGIYTANDVEKVFELGAEGILINTIYTKSKDPNTFLMSIARVISEK